MPLDNIFMRRLIVGYKYKFEEVPFYVTLRRQHGANSCIRSKSIEMFVVVAAKKSIKANKILISIKNFPISKNNLVPVTAE